MNTNTLSHQQALLRMNKEEAQTRIDKQVQQGHLLLETQAVINQATLEDLESGYHKWYNFTIRLLKNIFGDDQEVSNFSGTKTEFKMFLAFYAEPQMRVNDKTRHIQNGITVLSSLLEQIIDGLFKEDPLIAATYTNSEILINKKVFIVHGHDHGLKEAVARLLEKQGLEAIILHEQANMGRSIIQKFEDYAAEACFAIVLLTPDDIGGIGDSDPADFALRARQNVIFELGYFRGYFRGYFKDKLSGARVCVLYSNEVELPSDIQGVLFVPYNKTSNDWKHALLREMHAVGINVDQNKVTL